MDHKISISKSELAAFCQTHGIRKFAIFGSALGEDFRAESDIDILVEFESGRIPGLLGVASMESKLSALFGGQKVDL